MLYDIFIIDLTLLFSAILSISYFNNYFSTHFSYVKFLKYTQLDCYIFYLNISYQKKSVYIYISSFKYINLLLDI